MALRSKGGHRFVAVGVPLIMLTVGGWLGVAHVLSGKFELKEARERYVELKPSAHSNVSLESELRRTQQQLGDGDYENKPVPQTTL